MKPQRSALSSSITVEIAIHTAVVVFVYLPILVILFPAALILTGTMIASSFSPGSAFTTWLTSQPLAPTIAGICVTLLVALISFLIYLRRPKNGENTLKSLSGENGTKLQKLVSDMWDKLDGRELPSIRWFPAFDIAGYAATRNDRAELQVSGGLWQAAVSGDQTALAIIAHELAHLRNQDPTFLKFLDIIRVCAASVLVFSFSFGLVIFCLVFVSEAYGAFIVDGFNAMMLRSLLVIVGAFMVLIIFPLSWLALRRHIGFIHSLLEIRADVDAALWTDGRENFTQAFATSKSVRRTGGRELLSALLTRKLSHIPERERLLLLKSPSLIITPKTQFFALSLLLAVALPLNFASGLYLGGTPNHLVALSVAIALNAALVCLLVVGQMDGRINIGATRIAILVFASVIATSLPRINLEHISYLIVGWTTGFDGTPANLSTLEESIKTTWEGILEDITAALLNVEAIISYLVGFGLLWAFTVTGSFPSLLTTKYRVTLAVLVVTSATIIAGYDTFRSPEFPYVEDIADWFEINDIGHAILLSLPICAAFLVDIFFVALRQLLPSRN